MSVINLNEGGNVTVQYQGKTVGADPINLETTPRHNVTTSIKHFLSALHDHIQKHTGEHLFGKNKVIESIPDKTIQLVRRYYYDHEIMFINNEKKKNSYQIKENLKKIWEKYNKFYCN